MTRSMLCRATCGTGLAAAIMVTGLIAVRGAADDKPPPAGGGAAGGGRVAPVDADLQLFMRKKLEASAQVLEGLATDDLTLVQAGARQLNELSTAERWRVSTDPMYRQFSGEFRQITQQLIQAAEDGNVDRAAMKWMDATISCLDCHRFVRGMRIARE